MGKKGGSRGVGAALFDAAFALLARLPWRVLYALADVAAWVLHHVAGYRRGVARRNLAAAFPEMTRHERERILTRFYRNMADYAVETLKLAHVSDQEMRRRMQFVNIEIYDRLIDQGKFVATYLAHLFNWEWGTSVTRWLSHEVERDVVFAQVYRPLRNPLFDRLFLRLRSRFGSRSFTKTGAPRDLLRLRAQGMPTVTGFLSDQKPSHRDFIHVSDFLNQPTAFITGTEQLARRLGMAAVYWDMEKVSRGHYRVTLRLMADDASATAPMELTEQYARLLEANIRRDPALWLWTHKRWKHPVTHADEGKPYPPT